MPTEKHLEGNQVVLRPKLLSDVQNDYEWRVDEELARLDAAPPLRLSLEQFRSMSDSELLYPVPWSRRFAIDTTDGKHIGNCMYYDIDFSRKETELGILIGDRQYWSKGYGTDAVNTLLRHIFTETPITRVYLHTLQWNERAQKSFTKSGFRPVKNTHKDGYDFLYMETRKEEWEEMAQQTAKSSAKPASAPKKPPA